VKLIFALGIKDDELQPNNDSIANKAMGINLNKIDLLFISFYPFLSRSGDMPEKIYWFKELKFQSDYHICPLTG
jgi:hypothetical protein